MAIVPARHTRRQGPPELITERFLSGACGERAYEHCLTLTLTTTAVRVEAARWLPALETFEVPLDQITSVYVHAARLAPSLELHVLTWGGRTFRFSPRQPRLWAEYFAELGLVMRPHDLDVAALPAKNLGYRLRLWAAGAGAAAAAGALAAVACRFAR
ncbi:MAG: hypothetical protein IT307_19620 [Chloroflexi bacterium]|nr:hypothetical protein [Chloroflexota bacterium]